jgi:DUF4097 and DUF4098 domain-containing protein YvlB
MKVTLGRIASICLLGAILSYSAAGVVACTSTHDCLKGPKRSNLTLIQDSVIVPETIANLAVSSTIHRLKVERGTEPQGKLLLDNPNNPKTGEKEFTLKVEASDGRMVATVENLDDPSKLDHSMLHDLSLTIVLPARFSGELEGKTVSADIDLTDLSAASCQFRTVSGDLNTTKLSCRETDLNTTSGDFSIKEFSGRSLKMRSVSGDMSISYAHIEQQAEFRSVSGDVTLNLATVPAFRTSCEAVSGDCIITLPTIANADVAFKSVSGSISTKMPVLSKHQGEVRSNHELIGSIEGNPSTAVSGAARARIEAKTTSGDIELR